MHDSKIAGPIWTADEVAGLMRGICVAYLSSADRFYAMEHRDADHDGFMTAMDMATTALGILQMAGPNTAGQGEVSQPPAAS